MKIPKGHTVYIGRRKFTGEIPDAIAEKHGLLKKTEEKKAPKKASQDK
jgi:hypothetical protein